MGKRRTEIKKIESHKALQVCFSKRRQGLFKKAQELSRLCDVQVLMIVFSPAGRPYTFSSASGRSSPESIIDQYLGGGSSMEPSSSSANDFAIAGSHSRSQETAPWWDVDVSKIPNHQLHLYLNAFKNLQSDVKNRLEEMRAASSSWNVGPPIAGMVPIEEVTVDDFEINDGVMFGGSYHIGSSTDDSIRCVTEELGFQSTAVDGTDDHHHGDRRLGVEGVAIDDNECVSSDEYGLTIDEDELLGLLTMEDTVGDETDFLSNILEMDQKLDYLF